MAFRGACDAECVDGAYLMRVLLNWRTLVTMEMARMATIRKAKKRAAEEIVVVRRFREVSSSWVKMLEISRKLLAISPVFSPTARMSRARSG